MVSKWKAMEGTIKTRSKANHHYYPFNPVTLSKGSYNKGTVFSTQVSREFRGFQHKDPSLEGQCDRGFREIGWLMDRGINSPRTLPVQTIGNGGALQIICMPVSFFHFQFIITITT